jgi:hypothetical protein
MPSQLTIPFVALAIGAFSVRPHVPAKQSAQPVSLCAVIPDSEKYIGRRITVEADVFADGRHGSFLFDPRCPKGIYPEFDEASTAGEEFERAIFNGMPGTRDKDIHARFTGRFHIGSYEGTMCNLHKNCYILRIDSMENLTVIFKPGQAPPTPPNREMPAPIKW